MRGIFSTAASASTLPTPPATTLTVTAPKRESNAD